MYFIQALCFYFVIYKFRSHLNYFEIIFRSVYYRTGRYLGPKFWVGRRPVMIHRNPWLARYWYYLIIFGSKKKVLCHSWEKVLPQIGQDAPFLWFSFSNVVKFGSNLIIIGSPDSTGITTGNWDCSWALFWKLFSFSIIPSAIDEVPNGSLLLWRFVFGMPKFNAVIDGPFLTLWDSADWFEGILWEFWRSLRCFMILE